MITGFNTDIERDGVVYHVQTEDKGLDSPLILSLVYSGGEILAAKRTPYQDLIATGFTDEALAERLKRQHRLICAAINAGRIEELKQMSTRREEGAARPSAQPTKVKPPSVEPIAPPVIDEQVPQQITARIAPPVEVELAPPPPIPLPANPPPAPPPDNEFVIETSAERPQETDWKPKVKPPVEETISTEPRIPVGAVAPEPPTKLIKPASPQSAYTVYDSRRPTRPKKTAKRDDEVTLTILDEKEFSAGDTVSIRVLLQRHLRGTDKPLGGVTISIKVLGATFRPQIYSIKTQRDGVAVISIELPHFSSGRAAVVIQAEAHEQSVELRCVIHPRA